METKRQRSSDVANWGRLGPLWAVLLAGLVAGLAFLFHGLTSPPGQPPLPEHLAPWATNAPSLEVQVREEARLRMFEDKGYQQLVWEGQDAQAEATYGDRYQAEVEREVELIQAILATSARLRSPVEGGGGEPNPAAEQACLAEFLDGVRRGEALNPEAIEATLRASLGLQGS